MLFNEPFKINVSASFSLGLRQWLVKFYFNWLTFLPSFFPDCLYSPMIGRFISSSLLKCTCWLKNYYGKSKKSEDRVAQVISDSEKLMK